jgi:hypothetical protein
MIGRRTTKFYGLVGCARALENPKKIPHAAIFDKEMSFLPK